MEENEKIGCLSLFFMKINLTQNYNNGNVFWDKLNNSNNDPLTTTKINNVQMDYKRLKPDKE